MNAIDQQGKFFLTVYRADGKIEDGGAWDNLFVNAGMDYLATFQSTSPGSVMQHMHVGTVSTAATLTDTVLGGQVGSRVAMATRTTAGSNVLTEVATWGGATTGITSLVLREVGVFNHSTSGGTMRSRTVYAAITLGDSDQLRIDYRTTVGSR